MKLDKLDSLVLVSNSVLFIILVGFYTLLLTACGTQIKVKGTTHHEATVSGEARVVQEVVLRIDVSACSQLPGADQAQCIKDTVASLGDLVELIKSLSCKDSDCLGSVPQ